MIELKIIKTPIRVIQGTLNCFQLETVNQIQNCAICAEDEIEMTDWLTALTQNIINCN